MIKKNLYIIYLFGFIILLFISIYVFVEVKSKFYRKVNIVCTTNIIAQTVSELVGEWANIQIIMNIGVDPHTYKSKPGDIYKIENADLVFFNGLGLEGKMAGLLEKSSFFNQKIFSITNCIDRSRLIESEYKGIYDPHVWFDISLWRDVVAYTAEILMRKYPEYKDEIYAKKIKFCKKLEKLDTIVFCLLNLIPIHRKFIITSHDAFSYLSKRYNISVRSLFGISTDTEVCMDDLERIARIIVSNEIPTVFIENTIPEYYMSKLKEVVEEHIKTIEIGDKLYTDSLGNTEAVSYIDFIYHNINAIINGLAL